MFFFKPLRTSQFSKHADVSGKPFQKTFECFIVFGCEVGRQLKENGTKVIFESRDTLKKSCGNFFCPLQSFVMRYLIRELWAELKPFPYFIFPTFHLLNCRHTIKGGVQFYTIEMGSVMFKKICFFGFFGINFTHPILATPFRTANKNLRFFSALTFFENSSCLCPVGREREINIFQVIFFYFAKIHLQI